MTDFKNIACIIPTSGGERWASAYAAVASVLLNTTNNTVCICYNDTDVPTSVVTATQDLVGLANCTGNDLYFHSFKRSQSKSSMMMEIVDRLYWSTTPIKYLMGLDDDFLIPGYTFGLIGEVLRTRPTSVYIYGLMDCSNKRNHIDYDSESYPADDITIKSLATTWGNKILPHRIYGPVSEPGAVVDLSPDTFLMRSAEDFKRNHGAGSWIVPLKELVEHTKLNRALSNWPKTRKGEDVTLVKALGERIGVKWIVGSNSFHTDFNGSELNATWGEHLPFDALELDL